MNKIKTTDKSNSLKVRYNKTVLPNGLRIISEQVPDVESFALGISVDAGSRDDYNDREGIAHFIEHSVFRRSSNYSGKQIVSKFESIGAYINAYTTKEMTCYYVRALKAHLKECFDLLAEVVFEPAFLEKDINKERSIIIEEIKSYEDDPEEFIFDIGDGIVFKNHALANSIAGTVDSVKLISRDDIRNFHNNYYCPQNAIISMAGSYDHNELVELCKEKLINLKPVNFHNTRRIPVNYIPDKISSDKSFQQAHLLLITSTEGISSKYRYPLAIINSLLGDGMSSRLNQKIREKFGYVYSVYSTLALMSDSGTLGIYAATENRRIDKVRDIINNELKNLSEKRIPKTEINRAKEQLKSSTIMALEGMSARMQALLKSELSFGYNESIEETIRQIDIVNDDIIAETAKKYLAHENWSEILFISKD